MKLILPEINQVWVTDQKMLPITILQFDAKNNIIHIKWADGMTDIINRRSFFSWWVTIGGFRLQ